MNIQKTPSFIRVGPKEITGSRGSPTIVPSTIRILKQIFLQDGTRGHVKLWWVGVSAEDRVVRISVSRTLYRSTGKGLRPNGDKGVRTVSVYRQWLDDTKLSTSLLEGEKNKRDYRSQRRKSRCKGKPHSILTAGSGEDLSVPEYYGSHTSPLSLLYRPNLRPHPIKDWLPHVPHGLVREFYTIWDFLQKFHHTTILSTILVLRSPF